MLRCKWPLMRSFTSRLNFCFALPQLYSIPTPANSGCPLTHIRRMWPRDSTYSCSAVFSWAKSQQLESTCGRERVGSSSLSSSTFLPCILPSAAGLCQPRSQAICRMPLALPT
eukprot:7383982-Prymnesium_polylepis.1